MKKIASFILAVLLLSWSSSNGQTIPVGAPLLEEGWRRLQLEGKNDLNTSFSLRPLSRMIVLINPSDSSANSSDSLSERFRISGVLFQSKYGRCHFLPITLKQQYNSHHPYGWNDGSMIPAKGYQQQMSFGVYSKIGPFSIQLQPEVLFADNRKFSTFPLDQNENVVRSHYTGLNIIDAPEKFGNANYSRVFPGQSSVRFNYKKLSLGVSTENLWWGPGVRNSLLMSNNAPGFPHVTFNTSAPILTPVGTFEGQFISGILKESAILPPDTAWTYNGGKMYVDKSDDDRYLNGMIVTWQPKWTNGLHLGFARVFYSYRSDISSSFDGYLPVLSSIFKKNTEGEDAKRRDQMLSAFFRLILPKEKAEVYGELGRNDHSLDSRDFYLEPEHSGAYVIGFIKLFDIRKDANLELMAEFANLGVPKTIQLRAQNSWYAHYQVRHGYTNRGQVIGAGIGPGGNSQTLGMKWIKGVKQIGVTGERVVRNNDFYYDAFEPFRNSSSHWVDLAVNLNGSWQHKRFIYNANLSRVKTLNYQWVQYKDVKNWHAQLSTSYLF